MLSGFRPVPVARDALVCSSMALPFSGLRGLGAALENYRGQLPPRIGGVTVRNDLARSLPRPGSAGMSRFGRAGERASARTADRSRTARYGVERTLSWGAYTNQPSASPSLDALLWRGLR